MPLFDRFHPRYLLPNAVTSTSIMFGLASMHTAATATSTADFQQAAWFVMYTVLLDKLDGTVARAAKASSEFGVQLDSFSDFLCFGIAPSFLMTKAMTFSLPEQWGSGPMHILLLGLGALYTVAAALRLAKFNITTSGNHPRYFRGLPSTSAGGLAVSAYLTHQQLNLPASWLNGMFAWMLINAVLMVSNLPQPKFHLGTNKAWNALQIIMMIAIFIAILGKWMPIFPFAVATLYTVGGFAYGALHLNEVLGYSQDEEEDGEQEPAKALSHSEAHDEARG